MLFIVFTCLCLWSCLLCFSIAYEEERVDSVPVHLLEVYNITEIEYQALIDIYNTTLGSEWYWGDTGIPWNFTTQNNPCLDQWDGITCTTEPVDGYLHVLSIDLSNHELDGYLPDSIGDFSYLQSLNLESNDLMYGNCPDSIGQLSYLRYLNLHETFINGSIPDSIGDLLNLTSLDLGNNNLHGHIPDTLCQLTSLTYIDLGSNALVGTIPGCFGELTKLQYLIAFNNYLQGTIPPSIGNLTNLIKLRLEINTLTGSIPNQLSNLSRLIEIDFSVNQLTGTIPAWLGNITGLLSLDVSTNHINGTIPHQLGALTQIELFYVYTNHLTGTIPLCFSNFTLLQDFNIQQNELSGPFPAYISTLPDMYFLTTYENYLTGTLASDWSSLPYLIELNTASNYLEGPLPVNVGNMSNLLGLIVSNNKFTGSVPSWVFDLAVLHVAELGLNQLTGPIPEPPNTNASTVTFFSVGFNHMTGTIPAAVSSLINLVYLNLSFNHFTQSMPVEITYMEPLNFLYLSNNLLTGALPPDWDNLQKLSYIFMDNNLFTGGIPQSIGHIKRLVSLNLSVNHLTGTVPQDLSRLKLLQVLLLQDNALTGSIDGVFNASHQQNLTTVQLSHNQLTGTLPDELFASATLAVFAALSNCFTGSLPLSICNSTTINTLALDGLQSAPSCQNRLFPHSLSALVAKNLYSIGSPISGGVPECLFRMPALTTLHLSGNGLTGTLPSSDSSADSNITPTLTDLSLSHNKLSGSIPSALLNRAWTKLDLSYNLLTQSLHEAEGTSFPHNASIFLEQNRLSGKIPGAFENVRTISLLESNLFSCDTQGSDLPSRDPNVGKYQCGSDTLNETLYAWIVIVCVVGIGLCVAWRWRDGLERAVSVRVALLLQWWTAADLLGVAGESHVSIPSVKQVCAATGVVVRVSTSSTLWCLLVLMPMYIAMSAYYGTYTHQYAWALSAAYLSGAVPFALEFAFLTLLIVVAYVTFRLCAHCIAHVDRLRADSVQSTDVPQISVWRRLVVYACYVLLTFTVVLGVNIAYVVIALNENGNVLTLAQFALALFKVGFNSICSPVLMRFISHRVLQDSKSSDFVSIQLFVSLVNNILIPCFVVAVISPSCFYNIFEAPDAVKSSYQYSGKCVEYNNESRSLITCRTQQVLTATTSYDPPFTYSYQCSSSFITYYAPAYVIMCILAGFAIPVMQLTLQALHRRATPGTKWYSLLNLILPRILKPLDPEVSAAPRRNVFALHFDAQQHLTTLLTYLGLLLTFGAVFPPLALCFLVALSSIITFTRLKVGRFLHTARAENMPGYTQIINEECENVGTRSKLRRAVLMVLVFSCVFYTLFLFDTLGDAVGFGKAFWVIIVVPLIPMSLYFFFTSVNTTKNVRANAVLKSIGDGEVNTAVEEGGVEMKSIEETVQNPIRNKNTDSL